MSVIVEKRARHLRRRRWRHTDAEPLVRYPSIETSSVVRAAALQGLHVGRDNKALLVADRGTIISINSIAARLVGHSAGDLVGRVLTSELFEDPEIVTSDDHAAKRWETDVRTANGDRIPVEVVREPLGDLNPGAMVYALRDLRERRELAAERRRKDQALRERERELSVQSLRFDTAVSNMPQGLAMFDGERHLLVSNRRFADLYGLSAAAVRPGLPLETLSQLVALNEPLCFAETEDDKPRIQRLENGRVLAVLRRPMPDGGFVVTTEDITERERDRARLEEYTAKLETSNGDLQNFAYVASHDLQEPLRKIETFTDRILRRHGPSLPEDVGMPLERIQDAARRMRALIVDLLGYARLSNDRLAVSKVDLEATLAEVRSDMQVRIEETGADLISSGLPAVEGDRTLLRQLLQNLVSNALKFSRAGVRPVVTVASRRVVRADGSDCLVISVADNGIGFDNQNKEKIFQIFQRLHGRSEYEGTGVGLATCRRIAERHGGSIDADGRPGEGATFLVTLPLAQARPYAS